MLDLGITKCFMKFFFNFKRVLLATMGCSRTLKPPNYPPLCVRDAVVSVYQKLVCQGVSAYVRDSCVGMSRSIRLTPLGGVGCFLTWGAEL